MFNRIVVVVLTSLLFVSACGGDKQTSTFNRGTAVLSYSYPYQAQREVPPAAPIVLHFSSPLIDAAGDIESELTLLDSTATAVPVSVSVVGDQRSLMVTPIDPNTDLPRPLQPASDYTLVIGELNSEDGSITVPQDGIVFTTRADATGPLNRIAHGDFDVLRWLPDQQTVPVMDFSALRVQMSRPLERSSVRYGQDAQDTLRLEDSAGALVDAVVLVKGHYLTVDPIDDLTPGEEYTLSLSDGIRSTLGDSLPAQSMNFRPANSHPRSTLVQQARNSQDGAIRSRLTGAPINAVPVNARLLGDDVLSQQEGDVFAELADLISHPNSSPLRVPRGSLLKGGTIDVDIFGEVPAGFETGDISVTFVSDGNGYLLDNEYNTNPSNKDIPKHVRLMIDVAMTAEDPRANGALSQNLLHVELAGIAYVRDGLLEIDAIGVVEPEVLGLERAWGLLSFNMVAYEDQKNAPLPPVTDFPELQSWTPGEDHQDKATPGDPITLNFTQPLDPASLARDGGLSVSLNGLPVPFDWHVDGASVVIYPEGGVRQPRPGQARDYQVQVGSEVTDLTGNPVAQGYTLDISLPEYLDSNLRSPLPLTVYPGYPCATENLNLSGDGSEHHGRCLGGKGDDDLLPVQQLPENRPIRVQFSQDMHPASFELGGSVIIEREVSGVWEPVPGQLETRARVMTFQPDEAWQAGALYRYTLRSNGNKESSSADCGGMGAICSVDQLPLQTALLTQDPEDAAAATGGGPDMVIHFRGGPASDSIFQPLSNQPTADRNANFIHEPGNGEPMPEQESGSGDYITPYNSTNIITRNPTTDGNGSVRRANVGCGFTGSVIMGFTPINCPQNRYIYLTGALNAEILGYDESEQAIAVDIHPTVILTSSLMVVATTIVGQQDAPTGMQVMRMRYREDPETGLRSLPNRGWIRETPNGPILEAELDLYLDAPELDAEVIGINLDHNQRSFPLAMQVAGPIEFFDDGRMQIVQENTEAIDLDVAIIGPPTVIGTSIIHLRIPAGGVNLSFVSESIK